jgi:hypothetical protein
VFVEVVDPAGSLNLRRLHATLAAAADAGPKDFAELLLSPGIGARTVRSLRWSTRSFRAPPTGLLTRRGLPSLMAARTGIPFPVPITVYDQTIRVLKTAVAKARLGREEELAALKRLDDRARRLEGRAASSVTSAALSIQAKGGALFTLMRARDLEGIVAKRLNDPYKAQVTWFTLMRWDRRGYPLHPPAPAASRREPSAAGFLLRRYRTIRPHQ